jgi:tetrahedral aminopeptidase
VSERESVIARQIDLTELIGCPGHEQAVGGYVLEAVRPMVDRAWIDPLGSVLAVLAPATPRAGTLRIMLDAHTDEVGFMVSHVDEQGFLRIQSLGGIDKRLLLGSTIELLAVSGERVLGIIGSLPPHVTSTTERERVPDAADMFVDIGASSASDAARRGVRIGTVGTFACRTRMVTEDLIVGKAFDNRTACNVIIHVLERLRKTRPDHAILCAFSVQEEVGLRGTGSAAFTLEPDIALAVENTTATDVPGVPGGKVVAEIGKGPAVTLADNSHIVPRRILDRIRMASEGLPWQYKRPVYGGTDAGRIAVTRGGIPTGVVSVPCRYIHAPMGMASVSDILATIELVTRFCSLPPDPADTFAAPTGGVRV